MKCADKALTGKKKVGGYILSVPSMLCLGWDSQLRTAFLFDIILWVSWMKTPLAFKLGVCEPVSNVEVLKVRVLGAGSLCSSGSIWQLGVPF